jgi:hypothetical protein
MCNAEVILNCKIAHQGSFLQTGPGLVMRTSMSRGVTVCKTSLPSASLQVPFQSSCRWKAVCKYANLQYCSRCILGVKRSP